MPGPKSRNRGQRKSNLSKQKTLGDITINDFANASTGCHSRLKMSVTNITSEVQQRLVIYEDPVTENDDFSKSKQNGASSSEGNVTKGKAATLDQEEIKEDYGNDYPLDLWFLISEHIYPETVGKFASICKKSNYVTHTAKFWFHLSKRFHRSVTGLPQYLQPGCIKRLYGLRACVIRALHFSYYQLLKESDNKPHMEQKDPHSLVKRRCSLMWHKQGETRWYFFFKLKELKEGCKKYACIERMDENRNENYEFNSHNNVMFNPEEGCKVLRVTCLQYSMVPLVIGLTLQTVSMHLSPGFEHHRLVLGFGSVYVPKTPTTVITLIGVVHIDVFDWWQIQYPYQPVEFKVPQSSPKATTYDSWEQIYSGIRDWESIIYT